METIVQSLIDVPSLVTLASVVPSSVAESSHAGAAAKVGEPWIALIPALPIFGVILAALCAIFEVGSMVPAFLTVGCLGGAFLITLGVFLGYEGFNHGDPF
ncbi:MAG: hypothetical protein ACIARR_08500, partial [Phycisphaerales bacterium JB059]